MNTRISLLAVTALVIFSSLGSYAAPKASKKSSPASAASQPLSQARRLRLLRTESLPARLKDGGEPEGGPNALALEKFRNRAYPGTDIPMALTQAARQSMAHVHAESMAGIRGPVLGTSWTALGPTTAQYPAVLGRTGAAYIASGRISALAISPVCTTTLCRLYVGAAGGGVWRTDKALASAPVWTPISSTFLTNAIGSITLDPSDSTGNTIYVGTGEPNASADSSAGQGIYKSIDGGNTWTLLAGSQFAVNRSISNVVIDPTNKNSIYVGTTRGIRGFSAVIGGGEVNPPSAGQPVGLYHSADGGVTFTALWLPASVTPGAFSQGVDAVALDPTDPKTVYASAFGVGVYRSSPTDKAGAFQKVFVSLGYNVSAEDYYSRSVIALTTKNGHTRMYVGDGGGNGGPPNQAGASVWRNDNMNQPASVLVVAGANGASWKNLSSPNLADPGYATYNYCTGQCWYDNAIFTPAGFPDTVFVLGSFVYPEARGISNARTVLRSTTGGDPDPAHNNRTFTDLTFDATSPTKPNSIHPDQHVLVTNPGDPTVWFNGSDGGLMRSSGAYADVSSACATRGLTTDGTTACQRLLSAVPTVLTSLNTGLNTLQFQSLSINPKKPTTELMGGTQDNGTFRYQGTKIWPQVIGGDGGQSGFNATNPTIRFHTYYGPQVDVNFRGVNPLGWDWISDSFRAAPAEAWSFYIPAISDPTVAKANTMFAGLQGIWRTTDNGGVQSSLDLHCNEFTGDFAISCGDWVELASPTGVSDPHGNLTSTFYGSTKSGGVMANITRTPADTSTLWGATTTGRVFISHNADSVSSSPSANGSSVTFTRLDSLATNAPQRFVSGIAIDPKNTNHAWVSYSGYSAVTPTTPGHIFDVTYNPVNGTATWTKIDGSLGDIPVTALVRDDKTGDLYSANDFGVLRLAMGSTVWQSPATGLPSVEVPSLVISPTARLLYAATHGRGAYSLTLP